MYFHINENIMLSTCRNRNIMILIRIERGISYER